MIYRIRRDKRTAVVVIREIYESGSVKAVKPASSLQDALLQVQSRLQAGDTLQVDVRI